MSKYNRMQYIPFKEIPESEKEQAVKEWAEGNLYLENLLWTCFSNGIETIGCHAGPRPYIDFKVNNAHDEIGKILDVYQEIEGAQILICPDGGNPFGGPDWYKPSLGIGFLFTVDEKDCNEIFAKMQKALTVENKDFNPNPKVSKPILDFYDFFAGKESDLNFRIKYALGEHSFTIESYDDKRNLSYFNDLFKKAGLTKMKRDLNIPIECWSITAKTPEEFCEKMIECKDIIIKEYSLDLPSKITKDMTFHAKARIMRRTAETPEQQKQFEKWLQDEKKKRMALQKTNPLKRLRHLYKTIKSKAKNIGNKIKTWNPLKKGQKATEFSNTKETSNAGNRKKTFMSEIKSNVLEKDTGSYVDIAKNQPNLNKEGQLEGSKEEPQI